MRYGILTAATLALVCASASAFADEDSTTSNPHPFRYGFGMDLGVPSGVSLGFVFHPKTDAISLEASFTENVLSPGGRLSLQLDPLALLPRLPVALYADVQAGFTGRGTVPGHSTNLPSLGYDYVNFYGGLRLGRAQNFHWFFEAGPTYLNVTTGNFQSIVPSAKGLTVGNPTATAWVVPTFVTGFQVSWP